MGFYIVEEFMTDNCWYYNKIDPIDRVYDKTHPPFCPYCGRQLRDYVTFPLNSVMDIAKPYFCDMIYTLGSVYVTERFRDSFEKSGLKGIENFREITLDKIKTHNGVRKAKLPEPPRYFMADLIVDGATIDLKKSKAVFHRPEFCHYCMFPTQEPYERVDFGNMGLVKWDGYYIDQTRWNGNNIFVVLSYPIYFAVDQKFKDWFEENQFLPGCRFIPEQDYKDNYINEYMTNTYSFE